MATYLLTFTKSIHCCAECCGGGVTVRTEPWHTTINAEGIEKAQETAKYLGRSIRQRLPKGYEIILDGVEFVA